MPLDHGYPRRSAWFPWIQAPDRSFSTLANDPHISAGYPSLELPRPIAMSHIVANSDEFPLLHATSCNQGRKARTFSSCLDQVWHHANQVDHIASSHYCKRLQSFWLRDALWVVQKISYGVLLPQGFPAINGPMHMNLLRLFMFLIGAACVTSHCINILHQRISLTRPGMGGDGRKSRALCQGRDQERPFAEE